MKSKKLSAKVAGVRAAIDYEPKPGGRVRANDVRRLELASVAKILASPKPLTGEQVRWVRSVLGLDQIQFAKLLGMSRATIIRYEAHGDLPRPSDYAIRFLAVANLSSEGLELPSSSIPTRSQKRPARSARAHRTAAA